MDDKKWKNNQLSYINLNRTDSFRCMRNVGKDEWIELQFLLLFYRFPGECFHIGNQKYERKKHTKSQSSIIWKVDISTETYELLLPEEIKDINGYASSIMENCVNKGRYIVFMLSLVETFLPNHANMLLFDRLTGELFRFDPHGNTEESWEPEKLDEQIVKAFSTIYKRLLINPDEIDKLRYLTFNQVIHDEGPQIIQIRMLQSDRNYNRLAIVNSEIDNLIRGSCSIWCFIFIYLRMYYSDIPLLDVLKLIINPNSNYNLSESLYFVSQKISKLSYELKQLDIRDEGRKQQSTIQVVWKSISSLFYTNYTNQTDGEIAIAQAAWEMSIEQLFPLESKAETVLNNDFDEKSLMFGRDKVFISTKMFNPPKIWWDGGEIDHRINELSAIPLEKNIWNAEVFGIVTSELEDNLTDEEKKDITLRYIKYLQLMESDLSKFNLLNVLRRYIKYEENLMKDKTKISNQKELISIMKTMPDSLFRN